MAEESKKTGSGVKIIIAAGSVVIVGLIVTVVVLAGKAQKGENSDTKSDTTVTAGTENETKPKRDVIVNEDNAEQIAQELIDSPSTPAGYYEVTMNSNWSFPDGVSESTNAYVENVTTNTNDVYFDLTLADTEEVIYSSPVIPLGAHLEKFKLDKELAAGTYNCVCTYYLVDEDQNPLSHLNVSVKVTVEK